MTRGASSAVWFVTAVAGGVAALAVTWVGDWAGMQLERTFRITIRAWEFAAIQVSLINTPLGVVAAVLGGLSRHWWRGLGIGAPLHAVVFAVFVTTSDSF